MDWGAFYPPAAGIRVKSIANLLAKAKAIPVPMERSIYAIAHAFLFRINNPGYV